MNRTLRFSKKLTELILPGKATDQICLLLAQTCRQLQVLVATASLELGIDIGDVDLVCQIGSPRSIAAFLQRVGRSGHAVGATPRGRLFPQTRDELVECAALPVRKVAVLG